MEAMAVQVGDELVELGGAVVAGVGGPGEDDAVQDEGGGDERDGGSDGGPAKEAAG